MTDPELEKWQFQFGGEIANVICRERGEAEVGVGDEATVEPGERDEVAHAAEHDERGGYGKPPADLAAEERLRRALHHRP